MGFLEDMYNNHKAWREQSLIHCDYGGIHCVVTSPPCKGMVKIHPLMADKDIGAGAGMSISIFEYEIKPITGF